MELAALTSYSVILKIVVSIAAIGTVLAIRLLVDRALARQVARPNLRRRWQVSVRNGAFLVLALALTSVWADAIQAFTVSIVAVAVAAVIATKELIACMMGSLLRTAANSYAVGDRVAIRNLRGDVIDHNLLTTTLLEVDPTRSGDQYTGQAITFPNNLLLDSPVTNESHQQPFVLRRFSVAITSGRDWRDAERIILNAATAACQGYLEEARAYWQQLDLLPGTVDGTPEPSVDVALDGSERVTLAVTLPVPVGRQNEIQQKVVRQFLADFEPTDAKGSQGPGT